ncbi:LPD38 domain-containing protein [Desulfovibrio intestinalis]|uniref:Large polyvalent protein associated domain-containing protein n=1 Tax=Desulfovibrio intestinalis TaxID=58621 RepID=A0A7W8BYY9_9BACT|nr:LPD38 domain-containing protein [Desulfovibrio intestinalis]MBB5142522.1 hypothetical protein [Desulfovibrio intestinalis]
MSQANTNQDLYLEMRGQGYNDQEIRNAMRPMLVEGGFSDQEINGYFKKYDPATLWGSVVHGFQGSVTGLAAREKLPDNLSQPQLSQLSTMQRVGLQVGTLAGDMPTMAIGAALGLLGGPSAPVTVPASAMAITEGTRAIYMEHIKNGEVQNAEQFTQRMGTVLAEAGKGGVIGGATGGMGKLAGIGAQAAGAGAVTTGAATVTAEVATMPTVAAGLEGRLPEPHEFVDAAILVAGLKGAGAAGGKVVDAGGKLVPKLRDIYARTGKDPMQILEEARTNDAVRQDLLSLNRELLEGYAVESRQGGIPRDVRETGGNPNDAIRAAEGSNAAMPLARDAAPAADIAIETFRLSTVIDQLATDLGVPFRVGRLGPHLKNADGIYKPWEEVSRVRIANDISTIVHEAGHHLQKKIFGTLDEKPLLAFADELAPIATTPRKGQSPLPEGFAEFIARYVVDPQGAREKAPRFYDYFEGHLENGNPALLQSLQNARTGVRRWNEQPAVNEVLSQINAVESETTGSLRQTWRQAYTTFIDDLHPLKKAVDQMASGRELPAALDPYLLARTYRGAAGRATHFLERSPFDFHTGESIGKPLKAILEPVKNLDELRAYLVAKRGLELDARGVLSGIRKNAMEKTVSKLEAAYEKTAQDLYAYQDHVLNYYAASGMLGKETQAAMRAANKSYVPFYLFMGDMASTGQSTGSKGFSPREAIRKIKGSGREIIDPLESILKNTYAMIEAAEKNKVCMALADLARTTEGAGGLVEKLPAKMQGTRVSGEEVMRTLKDTDPEAARAFAEAVERGELDVSVFRPDYRIDKKTEISVMRDGKREVYQVEPELAKIMNGLDGEALGTVTKILAFPARVLRAGATLTPEFIARNSMRDGMSAFVQSEYGFKPWVDVPRGLFHAIKRDDLYWRWKRSGGDQATMLGADRTTVRRSLDDLTRTGALNKTWNMVKNPIELFRIVSELSEQASRLGEFYRAEKALGSGTDALTKAALASREVSMDFARIGARMRAANALIAFTNARVQGLDKMARVFVEHPVRSTVRAVSAITLPSVLLAIANHGDERIKEIPRWQHDLFWLLPVGDVVWRIPKPFELGIIFGSIPERITEWALDQMNGQEKSDAFRGLGATMTDIVKPPVLPTALVPIVEGWSGKSFAFDRPIIPASREGMLPEYQYTENTTELAKALSRFVGTLPGMDQLKTFSPAAAENTIRNYTGGSGVYVLQGVDFALRKFGALPDPVKPTPTLAEIPFVRAFVARHPSMGAESIAKFRERWQEASAYLKTINGLQKEYKYQDVANLMPYHVYSALEGTNQALSVLSRTIRDINNVPEGQMTADEKRQFIDALYFKAITVARYGNEVYDNLQPMIEQLKARAAKEDR